MSRIQFEFPPSDSDSFRAPPNVWCADSSLQIYMDELPRTNQGFVNACDVHLADIDRWVRTIAVLGTLDVIAVELCQACSGVGDGQGIPWPPITGTCSDGRRWTCQECHVCYGAGSVPRKLAHGPDAED